jgi:small-conductance mechanosensitive channel
MEENDVIEGTKDAGSEVVKSFREYWSDLIGHLPEITVGLTLLLIFILLGVFFRHVFQRRIARRIHDQLLTSFIGRMIFLVFLLVGLVIFMGQVGLARIAGGLIAGAGVSALVLGFAFRDIGENLLSGVFLAFGRPFRIGDIVESGDFQGKVKGLSLRNTHIRSFDGRDIFIPNANVIKNPLVNYTRDGLMRQDFVLGLDYGDDLAKAQEVIIEELKSITLISHSENIEPLVTLDEFTASTVNLRIYFWINTLDVAVSSLILKSQVMQRVFNALVKAKFNMPADIIELKIYQENQPIPVAVKEVSKFNLRPPEE